jgi:deoxycytidylate deaminase
MTETHGPQALPDSTEMVIALVAAVGTDVEMITKVIATGLSEYGYTSDTLRLSDYLQQQAEHGFRGLPFDEELWEAMTAGDELRQRWARNDALALAAISDIVATRDEAGSAAEEWSPSLKRHAFILRSLKTPDELETLRAVYGSRLVILAAYSPLRDRMEHLGQLIADSRATEDRTTWVRQPMALIDRDQKEERVGGQNVRDTFHRADFFIRGSTRELVQEDIERTLAILFGSPFRTPKRDEHYQFLAAGAALRSAEFGRQVGAAIATRRGSIIAVGANEVSIIGGGSHWEDEGTGNRDFEIGDRDTNRRNYDALAESLAGRIERTIAERAARSIASPDEMPETVDAIFDGLGNAIQKDLRVGGLKDLTEFGRAVHAEMAALLDAARRGVSVAGATLYSSTFPCHNCARHIVAAGIERVVFVEPYPKSRAEDLHGDSLEIDESGLDGPHGKRVAFVPFVGVAPQRYIEMFDAAARERRGHLARKDDLGFKQAFDKRAALPVFVETVTAEFLPYPREYRYSELLALEYFDSGPSDPAGSIRDVRETAQRIKPETD